MIVEANQVVPKPIVREIELKAVMTREEAQVLRSLVGGVSKDKDGFTDLINIKHDILRPLTDKLYAALDRAMREGF